MILCYDIPTKEVVVMTFAIHSFGCKVNIYESEYIINIMEEHGYKMVSEKEDADIYIINTCTVTNEADKKSRQLIHTTRKNHPNSLLIVMGCYAQIKPNEIDADIVIGNKYKSKIIDLIEEYQKDKIPIIRIEDISTTNFEDMYINRFITHTRAFVKIQDGCNAFCTYCIIPYARGGLRSKRPELVIKEVTDLVNKGYNEIVLTGIHTGRYGRELNTNLEELLRELVKIKGIYRIRLSSIEMNEVTDGIIDLYKNNKIMARHLHIPIQSGCDEILEQMGRKYKVQAFLDKIEKIRNELDDISITTDLIVGFPGETEEYFNKTIETLKKIKFTKIHTFPYSRRDGTVAAKMKNQVDGNIKKCRVRKILALSEKYEQEFYQNRIGKVYDGLVETKKDGTKTILTSNYLQINIDEDLENNELVTAQIESVQDGVIKGKIIK